MNHFLVLSVLILAVFSFLSVAVWSDNRRREREAYYRAEALKRIVEGSAGAVAVDCLREQERIEARQRRERLRIGGLVTTAASLPFTVFVYVATMPNRPGAWTLGLIPLCAGLALLAYGYFLFPRESREQ